MSKEIITFHNIEIEKKNSQPQKILISIYDVNINRIVVSTKVLFGKKGFKYFIREKALPLL